MQAVTAALAASIVARVAAAVFALAALPIYLRLLGVEAYGVIGVFASLQALLAVMDLGLSTALTRELAAHPPGRVAERMPRDLVRTLELAYCGIGLLMGAALASLAPVVATHWIKLETLPSEDVVLALRIAALSLVAGWPATLYGAGLAGLHRQLALAGSTGAFAAVRVGLTVLVLQQWPTLQAFFGAQLVASALQSAVMRAQLLHYMGPPSAPARAQWLLLARVRRFAGGMTLIGLTSVALTQTDKLVLSHLLRLPDFGAYSVAVTVAGGLFLLIGPVFGIVFPRLSDAAGRSDAQAAAALFHTGSQAMALLILPIAAVLCAFPSASLWVLTNDLSLSAQAAPALVLLVAGTACNGLMNLPYAAQLAEGRTALSVWVNLVSVCVLVPASWWAASHYGAVGGAAAWAVLNALLLLIVPHLMHRHLLRGEKWRWYLFDIAIPVAASAILALGLVTLVPSQTASRWEMAGLLAACWLAILLATAAALPRMCALGFRVIGR